MTAAEVRPPADPRAARRAGGRRLKQGPGWIVVVLLFGVLLVFGIAQGRDARTPEERVEELSKQIACPICDGESVFDSRNPTSAAIRNELLAQVENGQSSDAQILAYIEERFGEDVLLVPRAEGIDALVWILPVMALAGGVTGLAIAFRRWQREGGLEATDADRALVDAARARETGFDDEAEGARG